MVCLGRTSRKTRQWPWFAQQRCRSELLLLQWNSGKTCTFGMPWSHRSCGESRWYHKSHVPKSRSWSATQGFRRSWKVLEWSLRNQEHQSSRRGVCTFAVGIRSMPQRNPFLHRRASLVWLGCYRGQERSTIVWPCSIPHAWKPSVRLCIWMWTRGSKELCWEMPDRSQLLTV